MAIKKEELPLVMGQRVTIKVRGEIFTITVRGWYKGLYIVMDLPKVGADYFRIAPQTGIQIHYTKDGVFVNFKSTSILSFVQAISLLVIEYPRKFDTHNLRKHQRFKAHFPMRYSYTVGGQKIEDNGIVRDVSSGGILFTHSKQITNENPLTLSLDVPNCGAIQSQAVEIRNLRKNPKSQASQFVTGVKWLNLSPEVESIISKFLEMRTKDRRSESRQLIRQ